MYQSNAEWPEGTIRVAQAENKTQDKHHTKAEAKAVYGMLKKDGYGGDGEVFPVRVWVSEG